MAAKKTSKKAKAPVKSSTKVSGKKTGIAAELAALDAEWDGAEEKAGGGEVPDGKYIVRIEEAMIGNSKASNRLQVNWTLKIAVGEHAGRNLWKHDGITDTEGLSWLRTALARLGVEWPASAEELPETLEGLVGTFAEVQAKTKAGNDIQNVYFNKAVDTADVEASDEDGVVEEEAEEEETEEAEIEKGSRVTAEIDGEEYAGKVVKISGNAATVLFDDGEKLELDVGELTLEAAEDEEEEVEEEAEEEETEDADEEEAAEEEETEEEAEDEEEETEEEPKVTVPAKAKFTPADKKATAAAAKKHGFDVDEYDTPQDCVIDMAEYVGVSGNFKDWASLIAKVTVAKAKK